MVASESDVRIGEVLEYFQGKGVRLWLEGGQLHYRAPKGVLTPEDIRRLRAHRNRLAALLEDSANTRGTDRTPDLQALPTRAPLTFTQLEYWNLHRLGEGRTSMRQLAAAIRLRHPVSLDALQRSLREIVRRHDALRTRVVLRDGTPVQEIDQTLQSFLEVEDLTTVASRSREGELERRIQRFVLQLIDVGVDPLFAAKLFRLEEQDLMLVLAMDHIISDAHSMRILIRELLSAYPQALRSKDIRLPPLPVQFSEYATWLRNSRISWIETHGAYWDKRLSAYRPLQFPASSLPREQRGWDSIPLKIGSELKSQLQTFCRARHTTLAFVVLAAYATLLMRLCQTSDCVIQYQTDGRSTDALKKSIGFFASVLYLRITLQENDCFGDVIDRVMQEYCAAFEHADACYLAAQLPAPEFARSAMFNWVPRGAAPDEAEMNGAEAFNGSTVSFVSSELRHLEAEYEPVMLWFETDEELVGDLSFQLSRLPASMMEQFAQGFLRFLQGLSRDSQPCIKDIVPQEPSCAHRG